jgi:chromosome segregation ATPase
MALTKKMLQAMDLSEAQIDQIIEAHRNTINGLTDERDSLRKEVDDYKAQVEKLQSADNELVKAKAKLEDAENVTEKLKALQAEFEDYKADVNAKQTQASKEKAYRDLLKEAGVSEKRIDSVVKVSDLSNIEFDDDGKVKDSKSIINDIKSEWADFIVNQTTQGAKTPKPPANNGGSEMSKEDIMKIKDTTERQQAIRDYANTHGGW